MENSIIKNVIFNVLHKGLSLVFPVITISYVSRVLGATGVGEIATAENFVMYFIMFASVGIPSYGIRAISQVKKEKLALNTTFFELFIINTIATIIVTIVYFNIIVYNNYLKNYLFLIFSSMLIFNIFNLEWFFQGIEEYRYIMLRSLVIKIISLILLFIFVKSSKNIIEYAIILCFGQIGNYFLNLLHLKKYLIIDLKNLHLKRHLLPISIFFITILAIEIYLLVDITMLSYFTTSKHVGFYSNSNKIIKIVSNTITAIGAVLLPRLSYYFKMNNLTDIKKIIEKFFNGIILFSIPSCIGIILVAKEIIILIFGQEFLPCVKTIQILSIMIILLPFSGGLFGQILLTSEKEKKYLYCVTLGAIVNIILNYILIPKYQENGAAIASIITELIVNIIMCIFSLQILKFKIFNKNLIKVIFSCILLIIFEKIGEIFFINTKLELKLFILICLGIIGYLLGLVLTKHEFLNVFLKKLSNKQ